MRRCLLILAVLTAALAAALWVLPAGDDPSATAPAAPTAVSAPAEPAAVATRSRPVDAEWPVAPAGAAPDLTCVYATDDRHAVVGGAVAIDGFTLHACLFRTADGGESWAPVGPALEGSVFLAVHADGRGGLWAVARNEDDDRVHVASSRDDGRTWRRSEVAVPGGAGRHLSAARIAFTSPEQGVLVARFAEEPARQTWLATRDGGATWRLSHVDGPAGALHADAPPLVATPDGWSWRLNDGHVERLAPDARVWEQTFGQPIDGYDADRPEPFLALALAR